MAEPYLGEVRIFAGNFPPQDWAPCNGQLMAISQHMALFSILGTTYGGDGITHFALPDLQGRVPVHAGQGPGLSPYVLGQTGGQASVTLQPSQMPVHSHALLAAGAASTGTPGPDVALASTAAGVDVYGAATHLAPMGAALAATGGSQPHENQQPWLGLNFIIALEGVYPSRN
jgi:microcystin-dependent protein